MRPAVGAPPPPAGFDALLDFVARRSRLLVLTGAGMSTASGIPAYRDADGQWLRRDPILFQDFIASAVVRRRYWARSYFGWQLMHRASPNPAHQALAALERASRLSLLVTQNVDGLHARAGSRALVELHGRLAKVKCLTCAAETDRHDVQRHLEALNPDWRPEVLGYNPDGDAELDAGAYPGFRVADCAACGGPLKPDVVFFGEPVPARRAVIVAEAKARSDGMLVVGSSLVVMSGYRIVRQAAASGLPVVAVNDGRTRADDLLQFKVGGDCVGMLERLGAELGAGVRSSAAGG
jgi:NAD-dependent SIR2 family protein deacetylase